LAVGSFNFHGGIFFDRFKIRTLDPNQAFSGCAAWGYERVLYAILTQKGVDFSSSFYKNLLSR